jgi:hypothetical protein
MQNDDIVFLNLHVQNNYESKQKFNLCFVIKYAPFLLKIGKDFLNYYYKKNAPEIGEIYFKTHLSKFVSNVFLTLKIMSFKNVSLIKVIQFYIIQSIDTLYKLYKSRCSQKPIISSTQL